MVVETIATVGSFAMIEAPAVYLEAGIGVKLVTVSVVAVSFVHIHLVDLNVAAVRLLALVV